MTNLLLINVLLFEKISLSTNNNNLYFFPSLETLLTNSATIQINN